MTAFFSESRPSAGVYFTSPVCSREEQLTMASMGALLLGSPPPRWITGSPLSRSNAAVSFSFRVGDSDMDLASWLKLMPDTSSEYSGPPQTLVQGIKVSILDIAVTNQLNRLAVTMMEL